MDESVNDVANALINMNDDTDLDGEESTFLDEANQIKEIYDRGETDTVKESEVGSKEWLEQKLKKKPVDEGDSDFEGEVSSGLDDSEEEGEGNTVHEQIDLKG